ncbi:MAG TPA: hypothetical protein VJP59_05970 [Gemmatimonadota bacterium]|nr:hypothetical protein [Gemmatimonadota bacterium]
MLIFGSDAPLAARQTEAVAEVVAAALMFVRDPSNYDRLADAVSDYEDACPHSAMNIYAMED